MSVPVEFGPVEFGPVEFGPVEFGPVEVWLTSPERIVVPDDLAGRWGSVLSPSEIDRAAGYASERARRSFLVGRLMLRVALSRRRPEVAPGSWRFRTKARGRLELAEPHAGPSFNLSHTDGLTACALTSSDAEPAEIGVDVERIRPRPFMQIADDFFAPTESEQLRKLADGGRRDRFFALWTLKEAYVKARGEGFAIELHSFAFDLEQDVPKMASCLDDDATSWRFASHRPTHEHRLGLAVRTGLQDLGVSWKVLSPLALEAAVSRTAQFRTDRQR